MTRDNSLSSPHQIQAKLELIDADLAGIVHRIENAAGDYFRGKRDFELNLAKAFIDAEGKNKDERQAKALLSLMKSDTYKNFVIAEGEYHGLKHALSVFETRASIGQSLLRAQTREGYGS